MEFILQLLLLTVFGLIVGWGVSALIARQNAKKTNNQEASVSQPEQTRDTSPDL